MCEDGARPRFAYRVCRSCQTRIRATVAQPHTRHRSSQHVRVHRPIGGYTVHFRIPTSCTILTDVHVPPTNLVCDTVGSKASLRYKTCRHRRSSGSPPGTSHGPLMRERRQPNRHQHLFMYRGSIYIHHSKKRRYAIHKTLLVDN